MYLQANVSKPDDTQILCLRVVGGCCGTTMRLEKEVWIAGTSTIHGPLHVAEDGDNVEDSLNFKHVSQGRR